MINPKRPWKRAVFSQYPRSLKGNRHRGHGDIMGYAVRTDRFRYVQWQNWKTKAIVARELYDHQLDPNEMRNIAGQDEQVSKVKQLESILAGGWKAVLPAGGAKDQR